MRRRCNLPGLRGVLQAAESMDFVADAAAEGCLNEEPPVPHRFTGGAYDGRHRPSLDREYRRSSRPPFRGSPAGARPSGPAGRRPGGTSAPGRCPRRSGAFWDPLRKEVRPQKCSSNSCPDCVSTLAWRFAQAVTLAAPDFMFTLTQVGADWLEIAPRMNRFRRSLSASATRQDVYFVEPDPGGGGGCHVHGYWRGPGLREADLSAVAQHAGLGRQVDLVAVQPPVYRNDVLSYGLKCLLPPRRERIDPDVHRDYLRLNGQRIGHSSHGFWQDHRTGEIFTRRRDAETVARAWLASLPTIGAGR